jgi:hypothetical protein
MRPGELFQPAGLELPRPAVLNFKQDNKQKTVGEASMDAAYFRALASRCQKSSRSCSDLFAKEELRHLATELEATAHELEGQATTDPMAETWRRTRPSRGYEGER